LMVAASLYLGMTCAWLGDYRDAGDFFETGLGALVDGLQHERCGVMGFPAVLMRGRLAETLAERGAFREGLAHAREALRIAEGLDHPYSSAMACHSLGFLHGAKGDLEEAVTLLEHGVELAETWNLPVFMPTLWMPLGRAYALMGRSSEAISMLRSTMDRFQSMYGRSAPNCMINLSESLLCAAQVDEALVLARQALALARERGQRGAEGWALHLLAEVSAHRDPPSATESEDYYRRALRLAEALDMQPLVARCRLGLGELHRKCGAPDKAQAELSIAAALFRSMDMTFWLERILNALA